jgi:hypothetical protein
MHLLIHSFLFYQDSFNWQEPARRNKAIEAEVTVPGEDCRTLRRTNSRPTVLKLIKMWYINFDGFANPQ